MGTSPRCPLSHTACFISRLDDFSQRLQEARSAVSQCRQFIGSAGDKDDEGQKVSSKVRRALEKLRRITVRLIEDSGTPLKGEVTQLATDIIAIHEHTLSQGWVTTDVLTPAVESLFLLARTTLSVANPNTHTPAYDFLAHAKRLVSYCPSAAPEFDVHTHANYVRCLSGAFYNTAGTLYQASRHAAAIRFLQQGCELGAEALRLRDNAPESQETKQEESWKQLREQLHRRWELLGVCYSKISERKLAYEAFVQCIKAYPFANTEFVRLARSGPCGSAFDVSPTTKQLGTIVDRVTYIAACELFRQPGDVSLSGPMEGVLPADDSSRCIVGAILERQVDGLDGSKWKDGVENVISALLTDCLAVYEPQKMPIRRARVLVRCLEASYYGSGNAQRFAARHPDEIGDEVGALLSREHYGEDAELVHFVPQYWAAARLWQALHAHRLGSPKGLADIPTLLEQACDQLKPLALPVAPTSPRLSRSPVVAKKAAPSRATKTSTKRTATRRAPAKSSRQHPVTPPKARKALELMSTNALQTAPPQQSQTKTSTVLLDNFEKFFGLLEMAAQLLNLLGYVLARVRMLNVMKRLADRHGGHDRDGYVKACIDLAHEYVKLGKIEKAGKIYGQALTVVRSKQTSEEAAIFFLLRYAESLAVSDNILRSSTSYCEAMGLNECLHTEEKGLSTLGRVRMRVGRLERAASACTTFSVLQHARDEPSASTKGLLQALRLWNRALDSLARLRPSKPDSKKTSDPSMPCQQPYRDGLEWRVANGLLSTLFGLAQAYFSRGSAREAEYFIEQAFDLAHSLNAPAAVARALARKAEIQLRLWRFEESHGILGEALKSLPNVLGPDVADVLRLKGDYHRLTANVKDAQRLYDDAAALLDQLESMLTGLDGPLAEGRRSSIARGKSSVKEPATADCIVPALAATVLRQQIWLLREEGDDRYQEVLHRFLALPASAETKAEEVALMAKLTLQDVYNRFRGDMFLSSLAESTISIPMGCLSSKRSSLSPVIQDIISTLANSERLFWSDLSFISRRGQVPNVRSAILALALVRALQSSLGRAGKDNSMLAAGLLDHASAVALRRELLEAIDNKFLESEHVDDVLWPAITPNGSPLELPKSRKMPRLFSGLSLSPDGCAISDDQDLRKYWSSISDRCHTSRPDVERLSISHVNSLPRNWSIINICIAEDKSVMFVSRRTAGRQPTMFCLPLGGRRDVDEEEHLSYDAAIAELRDIIRLSDEGTRQAGAVKQSQEKAARVAWWAERNSLDNRLKALLENIEFCWLGGFKTILGPLQAIGAEVLTAFQARLDRIVRHGIKLQEKKYKSQVRLDDSILEWICSLSPQCHDEELEDLVYFILDFYQLHGTQVAIAEVDVDQVVVDLRMLLEDYSSKLKPAQDDEHMFLVVDRNAHEIPWESLPILRGRSVSRIPNSDFLFDRLDYARLRRGSNTGETAKECLDRAIVNPSKAYYVLNPSGDLKATEGRFRDWVTDMRKVGWDGIIGRQPSELEFVNALSSKDLLIYFGHGGGEQYIRSHRVRHLKRCAATMLWGCSSGTLRDMGDFDPIGTPYNYMLAGCPTLVANLWDVTDRDIDKFSQAVFDELDLTPGGVQSKKNGRSERQAVSVVKAVAQSRDACKLKYLTGAAPVVYGIPFYL
ncbi:hypothetical protein GLOTRDRAFT_80657 [Gloeophyllum trabeum ATCC 11539]|uniref:separase n=1 Tax=Gloeophyllum trabeum (strain ATCC 11539 / FP-39264 / Madison 617) TaxID=670483 RepID=S7PXX2_GLOTA|nr:uncharacterized protein GLOTRDRAFT_80657 [Gloeophyllum trabeum ATCC 11539]EPQ52368.1 hypothetical protein GLOTRDRAFT_80657 [Gloeophyllum trabeum ATCC 11539]